MANIKKIGTAVGTFSVALGVGFVMQNGDALASRFAAGDVAAGQPAPFAQTDAVDASAAVQSNLIGPELETAIQPNQAGVAFSDGPTILEPKTVISDAAVVLPEIEKVPQPLEAPLQLATLDTDIAPAPTADPTSVAPLGVECVPAMDAMAGPAASVALNVTAPCNPSESFTVHHQGMIFTAVTDENGSAELSVPALAKEAVMIVAFEDGDGAVATAKVPDFADYDRAVLQWQGEGSVMLSAYEGGAEFGDEGHVSPSNPGNMARLEAGVGGYLISLGEAVGQDGLMAEVYTFPTGQLGENFDVLLVAEAEITAGNCGQELAAQSIQISPSGQSTALDLTMMMPECDAVGDFLILQNMFEDLTIASK